MSLTVDHHFTCIGCGTRTPFDRRTWTIEREYDVTKAPRCIDCAKKQWRYDSERTEYTSIKGEPHIIERNRLASEAVRSYPDEAERKALNQLISFPGDFRQDEGGMWREQASLGLDRVPGVNVRDALRDLSRDRLDVRPIILTRFENDPKA